MSVVASTLNAHYSNAYLCALFVTGSVGDLNSHCLKCPHVSVVFGADIWTTIGHLSYIHDAYISLYITRIIIIYCNFNILLGIYTGICKYCHEADNQF